MCRAPRSASTRRQSRQLTWWGVGPTCQLSAAVSAMAGRWVHQMFGRPMPAGEASECVPGAACSPCSPGHSHQLRDPPEQPPCRGSRSLQGCHVAESRQRIRMHSTRGNASCKVCMQLAQCGSTLQSHSPHPAMQHVPHSPAARCSGVLSALSLASTGQPAATRGASTCVCPNAAP